jgi:hypothetical protein
MNLISRAEAERAGHKHFFTGSPCQNGHVDRRFVSNLACVTCASTNYKRWYRKNQKAQIARSNAWRQFPAERAKRGFPVPTRACPAGCESCGDAPDKQVLHLDHCHTSGLFRGWLCGSCNRGLGQFKDSIERMEKALAYLRRHAS